MPEPAIKDLSSSLLLSGKAHLCLFEQADLVPPPSLFFLLTDEQRQRADKFKKSLRRNQHVWSRLMLLAMAKRVAKSCRATPVFVEERPPLAPLIHIGDQKLFSSVSHSGNRVACLISAKPCAIDIERFDPDRPFRRYAEVAFAKEVAAALAEEKDEARAFYCAWGAYECAVKLERPREFRWSAHAPSIGELRVQTDIQNGWASVVALSPAITSLKKEEVSADDLAKVLLGNCA